MATKGAYADIGYFAELAFDGDTYRVTDAITAGVGTADVVETTASGGVDKYKTFIQGLIDAGEATFTINADPAAPVEVSTVQDDLVITFPLKPTQTVAATFTCDAFMTGVGLVIPNGDRMTQDISFKLSGKPTFTAGS